MPKINIVEARQLNVLAWLLFITGYKQTDIANETGVSQATISRYTQLSVESKGISFEVLETLCHYFCYRLDIVLQPIELLEEYQPEHFLINGINA